MFLFFNHQINSSIHSFIQSLYFKRWILWVFDIFIYAIGLSSGVAVLMSVSLSTTLIQTEIFQKWLSHNHSRSLLTLLMSRLFIQCCQRFQHCWGFHTRYNEKLVQTFVVDLSSYDQILIYHANNTKMLVQ